MAQSTNSVGFPVVIPGVACGFFNEIVVLMARNGHSEIRLDNRERNTIGQLTKAYSDGNENTLVMAIANELTEYFGCLPE